MAYTISAAYTQGDRKEEGDFLPMSQEQAREVLESGTVSSVDLDEDLLIIFVRQGEKNWRLNFFAS